MKDVKKELENKIQSLLDQFHIENESHTIVDIRIKSTDAYSVDGQVFITSRVAAEIRVKD